MKILAIDPGERRMGLATCDEKEITTRKLPVLKVKSSAAGIRPLVEQILEEDVAKVLVGHPLNMDGSRGRAAERSEQLCRRLQRELARQSHACEVLLWDERLTSFEAEQRLRDRGIPKAKAKEYLDSLAAQVLLEDYLASQKQ